MNLSGQYECPDCGVWKYPWEFYKNSAHFHTGVSTYCKDCHRERQKPYTANAKAKRQSEREERAKEALQEQLADYQDQYGPPREYTQEELDAKFPYPG